MQNTIERFSNRVENYIKYRPDYPRETITLIAGHCGLTRESTIADVGCGPGTSSRIFLENGNRVIGVEPNQAMRTAAETLLTDFANFTTVDGMSENTTLPDHSVDFVVAAQAFHWFDPKKARLEFLRILKPGGHIVLMWNERQLNTTPFLIEYEAFLLKYGDDYARVRHENVDQLKLRDFFKTEYGLERFRNNQVLDFDGLKGRMLSSSYMPNELSVIYGRMIMELKGLFAKHAENGRIRILYDTKVYYAHI